MGKMLTGMASKSLGADCGRCDIARAREAAASQQADTVVAAHAVIDFTNRGDRAQQGIIQIGSTAIPVDKGGGHLTGSNAACD